jgi:hypothetical protein
MDEAQIETAPATGGEAVALENYFGEGPPEPRRWARRLPRRFVVKTRQIGARPPG